jgi:hypothetical protein
MWHTSHARFWLLMLWVSSSICIVAENRNFLGNVHAGAPAPTHRSDQDASPSSTTSAIAHLPLSPSIAHLPLCPLDESEHHLPSVALCDDALNNTDGKSKKERAPEATPPQEQHSTDVRAEGMVLQLAVWHNTTCQRGGLGVLRMRKLRGRAFKGREMSCQGRDCHSSFVTHGMAATHGEEQEWESFRCPQCAKEDSRYVSLYNRYYSETTFSFNIHVWLPEFAKEDSWYVSLYNRCHKCRRAACFGAPGSPPGGATRCARHREAEMIDVRHPLCEYHEGCKKRAQYGGTTGQRHLLR